jgi:hypothetical protein
MESFAEKFQKEKTPAADQSPDEKRQAPKKDITSESSLGEHMALVFEDDLNPDERIENERRELTWEPGNHESNLIEIIGMPWSGVKKQRTFLEITVAHGQHIGRRARIMLLMDAETRFILKAGMRQGLVAKIHTEEFSQ